MIVFWFFGAPCAAEYLRKDPADLPDPQVLNLARAGWGFESTADYLACHRLAVEQGLCSTMPLIPGAAEAMQKLSDAGAHIRIVTHRLIFPELAHFSAPLVGGGCC